MSPDRLPALLRQRELLAQHLAWLDAEIAAARPSGSAPTPALSTTAALPETEPASEVAPPPHVAAANARADEILERYASTDRFDPESTRRGCLLFAIATLVLGLAGLFVLYVLRYR